MSLDYVSNQEIIQAARRNLPQDVWDYLTGGAESETTMRRNRLGFDCLALRPRVLVDVLAPAGAKLDVFAEGPTPEWSLPLPEAVPGAPADRASSMNSRICPGARSATAPATTQSFARRGGSAIIPSIAA